MRGSQFLCPDTCSSRRTLTFTINNYRGKQFECVFSPAGGCPAFPGAVRRHLRRFLGPYCNRLHIYRGNRL